MVYLAARKGCENAQALFVNTNYCLPKRQGDRIEKLAPSNSLIDIGHKRRGIFRCDRIRSIVNPDTFIYLFFW